MRGSVATGRVTTGRVDTGQVDPTGVSTDEGTGRHDADAATATATTTDQRAISSDDLALQTRPVQIGRASCRERVCMSV